MSTAITEFCPNTLYSDGCTTDGCTLKHDAKLCQDCAVICSPARTYNSHVRSKVHQDRAGGVANPTYLYCTICKIEASGPDIWRQHVAGARHRQNASAHGLPVDLPPVTAATVPDNTKFCVLCRKQVLKSVWHAHRRTLDHRRQESIAAYKGASEEAERDKQGVEVSHAGGIDFGVVQVTGTGHGAQSKLTVRSINGSAPLTIVKVNVSAKARQTLCPFKAAIEGSNRLTSGRNIPVVVTLTHNQRGRFEGRIELVFQKANQARFIIVRQVRATVGDTADHELLKVSVPYVSHRRVPWRRGERYWPGTRPPALDAVPWVRKLKPYAMPAAIVASLAEGSPADVVQRIRAASFWPKVFNSTTHGEFFKTLLWIEEYRMEYDLRVYDLADVTFKKEGRLYYLDVPGLAEKRPSVVVGDRIEVQPSGSTSGRCFEGWVHVARRDDVGLDFHSSFKPTGGQRFNVRFKLNRIPLRRQHQALGAAPVSLERILFPVPKHVGLTSVPTTANLAIRPFNTLIANNTEQLQAVRSILLLKKGAAPFIVFGPPGTGKTVTVVETIRQLLSRDPAARILACAPSNSAADILAQRLKVIGKDNLFRFYAVSRDKKLVPEDLIENTHVNAQGYFSVHPVPRLSQFRVVVSTCGSAAFAFGVGLPPGHFTHIFVDEAGQATEAEVMTAMKAMTTPSTQVVLSGDPKQLGPIIRSSVARELGFGVSYLERLMDRDLYKGQQNRGRTFVKLLKNFRSHGAILKFPNEQFYDSELQVSGSPADINSFIGSSQLVSPKFPVVFHAISGKDEREATSPSYFNIDEISTGKDYVQKLKADPRHPISDDEIGIIAPYNAQARKFRTALGNFAKDIKVASVEEFQGQERKVIILSTVRSSRELLNYDAKYTLGFVANPRRLNVAITRAKALLIVIGDPSVLSIDPLWRTFLNYIYLNGGWRGEPITWDPNAPVREGDTYEQELRDRGVEDITEFMQRMQVYTAEDLTEHDLEEGQANADRPWRESE